MAVIDARATSLKGLGLLLVLMVVVWFGSLFLRVHQQSSLKRGGLIPLLCGDHCDAFVVSDDNSSNLSSAPHASKLALERTVLPTHATTVIITSDNLLNELAKNMAWSRGVGATTAIHHISETATIPLSTQRISVDPSLTLTRSSSEIKISALVLTNASPAFPQTNNMPNFLYTLVISIGVAPGHFERRHALRSTWLRWAHEAPDVMYTFFTEIPVQGARGYTDTIERELREEAATFNDMVFQDMPSGYGKENGNRELYHIKYMLELYQFRYYLRIDDDGFLCLRQLLKELRTHMPPSVLQGKYHCHDAKARMDENYLLMSRDVCHVVHDGFATQQLPFAPKLTFALNLGNMVPILQREGGVHIFDDQTRICWPYGKKSPCFDAWKGTWSRKPGQFCDNFIWSHWVKNAADFQTIYALQINSTIDLKEQAIQEKEKESMDRALLLLNRSVCMGWPSFASGIPFYKTPHAILGPGRGIPGMRPLANDSDLLSAISANVSRLFKKYRNRGM